MTYFYEYLVFLAEVATVVIGILIVLSAAVSISGRRRHESPGVLEVSRYNDYLDNLRHGLEQAMLTPGQYRRQTRREAKAQAKKAKQEAKRTAQEAKLAAKQEQAQEAAGERDSAEAEAPADDSTVAAEREAGDAVQTGEAAGAGEAVADAKAAASASEGAAAAGPDAAGPADGGRRHRVYALAFEGDMDASKVSFLRHEINAILTKAEEGDEVVARVKSFGGRVHGYGLAASQLQRVREHGLNLVVAVDQVAASGGYLMAAVANQVIAAPFALVGSIGVVAEIPNIHRLLKKHDVDVEVVTAGRYKRTLTVLGENTEEGRRKFTEELEDLHALFQEFVTDKRPGVDVQKVATGEAWYGQRAIELNLVDAIMTSDEYLMRRCQDADVFEVRWVEHKKPWERVLAQAETGLKRLAAWLPGRADQP